MEEFLEHEIEKLQDLASDPTLESCCRRDIEDALKTARVKAQLAPQDRSQARERLAGKVLAPFSKAEESEAGIASEDEDCESEELEALRALRLEQLKNEARARTELQSQGHGTLSTIPQTKIFKFIENDSSLEQQLLIHFVIEGDEQGQIVDQRLELLARQCLGTRFVRCPVPSTSSLPQRFGLPPGLPGIVALYQGTILASSSIFDLQCEEDEDVDDAVEKWSKKRKLLKASTSSQEGYNSRGKVNDGGGFREAFNQEDQDSEEEEDVDEWRKPCEDCGRRYPHQHIRSIYKTTTASDDEENEI